MTTKPLLRFQQGGLLLEPTGLKVPQGLEFDAWAQAGQTLGKFYRGLQWAIGDWVNYGEATFGERSSQYLDELGFEEGYLSNLSYVASRFPLERRHAGVAWSMHQAVAALEHVEADRWLSMAEAKKWTREEFRDALKEAGVIKPRAALGSGGGGGGDNGQGALPGTGETGDTEAQWWTWTIRAVGTDADMVDRATRRAMEKYGVQSRAAVISRWALEYLQNERGVVEAPRA